MMGQEPGFEIHGRFFPMPTKLRGRDPLLIKEVTGMSFREFAEASDDPARQEDPEIVLGWVAVAVWTANQKWSRQAVVDYVGDLGFDQIKGVGGDQEDEPGPPALTGEAQELSPTSPTQLNGSLASTTPPPPTPKTSGVPG